MERGWITLVNNVAMGKCIYSLSNTVAKCLALSPHSRKVPGAICVRFGALSVFV